jgi:hypothetical protein
MTHLTAIYLHHVVDCMYVYVCVCANGYKPPNRSKAPVALMLAATTVQPQQGKDSLLTYVHLRMLWRFPIP